MFFFIVLIVLINFQTRAGLPSSSSSIPLSRFCSCTTYVADNFCLLCLHLLLPTSNNDILFAEQLSKARAEGWASKVLLGRFSVLADPSPPCKQTNKQVAATAVYNTT